MYFFACYFFKPVKNLRVLCWFILSWCIWSEIHESLRKGNMWSGMQQLLQAKRPGTSLVRDAPLLTHLRNELEDASCLKTPCLSLLTLGSWNGLFSVIYLFDYVSLSKESPSFEHEHKLSLKEPMTALIHHPCYFLESSHLLPILLLLSRRQLRFCQGFWC